MLCIHAAGSAFDTGASPAASTWGAARCFTSCLAATLAIRCDPSAAVLIVTSKYIGGFHGLLYLIVQWAHDRGGHSIRNCH
jgi:hypothetical protein